MIPTKKNTSVAYFGGNSSRTIRLNGDSYQLFIGSSGAYVRMNGKMFDVIYVPFTARIKPPPGTRNPRMTPSDARRLPWDTLQNVGMVQAKFKNRVLFDPSILRLHFSRKFQLRSSYLCGDNQITFIALSDRKKRVKQILMDRMQAEAARTTEVAACYVCLRNSPDAVFKPCGHSNICCACAFTIVQSTKQCPLCRGAVGYFGRVV